MRIFISNLNTMTTASHLSTLFLPFGLVFSAKIMMSDETGRSLGTGLVEMEKRSATMAIYELNNMRFMNYYISVEG